MGRGLVVVMMNSIISLSGREHILTFFLFLTFFLARDGDGDGWRDGAFWGYCVLIMQMVSMDIAVMR